MNTKRISSLAVCCLGIVLIIYALYSMNRISEAKSTVQRISNRISSSTIGKMMGGEMHKKASQYDTEVTWMLISGIILTLAGGGGFYFYRKHR